MTTQQCYFESKLCKVVWVASTVDIKEVIVNVVIIINNYIYIYGNVCKLKLPKGQYYILPRVPSIASFHSLWSIQLYELQKSLYVCFHAL